MGDKKIAGREEKMNFTNVEDSAQKNDEILNAAGTVTAVQQAEAESEDEELNFDDELGEINPTVIKIIGCGGGGSSAVQRMIEDGVSGVNFVVLNTDKQALHKSTAKLRVPIGQKITGGLGAGGNPEVGENAAKEDSERITKILRGSNMVIITAGMGGGTGTGSAPVVAEIAHGLGILTIAVVTTPFTFEGKVRMNNATGGIEKLRANVDSLIVLPNDQIFKAMENVDHKMTFKEQFKFADALLCSGVRGVTELITKPGDVNLDFADVSSIMRGSGDSILGVGKGKGENRFNDAVEGAIANPLLENRQIDGAKKILINMTSNGNIGLEDARSVADLIRQSADPNANIIWGMAENGEMADDEFSVTVIATDFDSEDEMNSVPAESDDEKSSDSFYDYGSFQKLLKGKKSESTEEKSEKSDEKSAQTEIRRSAIFDPAASAEKENETGAEQNFGFEKKSAASIAERETVSLLDDEKKSVRRSFTSEIPAGMKIDPNDLEQPAIYRRKSEGLSRSIDLTQL